MNPRTRNILLGCLGVGCLGMIALIILVPMIVTRVARPMFESLPTPQAIVLPTAAEDETETCDEEAVEAYIRDSSAQLNAAAASLSGLDSQAQLEDLDLQALQERREEHAALVPPACLESIHEAEMELAAFTLNGLEDMRAGDGPSILRSAGLIAQLYSGVLMRTSALDQAWRDFSRSHGIDVQRIRQRYALPASEAGNATIEPDPSAMETPTSPPPPR